MVKKNNPILLFIVGVCMIVYFGFENSVQPFFRILFIVLGVIGVISAIATLIKGK